MSGDLEQAIAAGATHVRVGSGVLGSEGLLTGNVNVETGPRTGGLQRKGNVMSGAMRKMGVYLGLLEDTDRYDDDYADYDSYDEHAGRARHGPAPSPRRAAGRAPPRRRPAAARARSSSPASPPFTRAPTTRRA